jgi:hypothetical protein
MELIMQDRVKNTSLANYTVVHPMARVLGIFATSAVEAYGTYPLDVLKNREMMGKKAGHVFASRTDYIRHHIIGPDHADLNFNKRHDIKTACKLTYRGVPWYLGYKLVNRGLKYGAQPLFMEAMMGTSIFASFVREVGFDHAKIVTSTIAGMLTGVIEVVINPVDRIKLLCQKNYESISFNKAIQLAKEEGWRVQYSAAGETAIRNAIGTGTLFFGKFTMYAMMNVQDHNKPTWTQSLISSMIGNGTMIVASHPFDLLKVRKQMAAKVAIAEPILQRGMMNTLFYIGKTEGLSALMVGLPAKLIGSGLKGTLIMSACEMLIKAINTYFEAPLELAEKKESKPRNCY